MQSETGPFLSAAAIRRVLALHPFSEANRTYLLEEAERREDWERDLELLVRSVRRPQNEVRPARGAPEVAATGL